MADPLFSFPFFGGQLGVLSPGLVGGSGFAVLSQFIEAAGTAANALQSSPNLRAAQEAALTVLQRPTVTFGVAPDPVNPLPAGFTIAGPTTLARDVDLGALLTIASSAPSVRPGEFDPSISSLLPLTASRLNEATRRAAFAATGPRNPFANLQQGPFVPCSSDDPKGRCLTPGARQLQARRVRALVA